MSAATITVGDGCRLHHRLDGPERAPFLVLSSSLGTDAELWEPQLEVLAESYRVLRYDMRGHGASDVPVGAYSIDRLVRDVLELLDALDVRGPVRFVGVSLGGLIGQWLAVRAPERVERLVLANTAAYMGPPEPWQRRIELVSREGMSAIAESVLERWFTPAFRRREIDVVARARAWLISTSPAGYAGCCAAIRDLDLRPTASLIAAPTLLVAGAHDPATPPGRSDELARLLRGSAHVATLEAAHLSNLEQPDAFNRALLEFLA